MKFPRFLMLCMALLSALWMGAAQALPSVDDVQAATQRGDYAGAEKMMQEVVAARPDSARAHYVLAEIQAHQRKFDEAATQARRARALDPAIKFADAAKFSAFEQLLQREQAAAARSAVPAPALGTAPPARAAPAERSSSGGVPLWMLIVGAGLFIWLAASWMRRRTAAQGQPAVAGGYGMSGAGYAPQSYGPQGYGPQGPGVPPAAGGSGLMGVGLAAAGGVAAGMLAEKLMHGGSDERSLPRDQGASAGSGSGLIPGSFDGGGSNAAADELTRRDVDFGSGDGWGGGDVGDAGGGGGDDW
jgi:hypothetical protein